MNNLNEQVKITSMVTPASYSAGTTYNGAADASGLGEDVSAYNEALLILDSGVAAGTNTVTIVSSDDNTTAPSTWDAVTSAEFTEVDSDNDESIQVARIHVGGGKKYIAVKSVVATDACIFGVQAVMNKAQSEPTGANTLVFNV